jgi:hypothetical protein
LIAGERLDLLSNATLGDAEKHEGDFVGNKVLENMIVVCLDFSFFPI